MRIVLLAAVMSGSIKSCSSMTGEDKTCDDIMSRWHAPEWCVQNNSDDQIVTMWGFDRPPGKYFADVAAGSEDGCAVNAIAPRVGHLTADDFGAYGGWLCLEQLDLATGVVEFHGHGNQVFGHMQYLLLETADGPQTLACFH